MLPEEETPVSSWWLLVRVLLASVMIWALVVRFIAFANSHMNDNFRVTIGGPHDLLGQTSVLRPDTVRVETYYPTYRTV